MPAPVSGAYVSRCLLAVSRVGGAATCRSRWILKKYFSVWTPNEWKSVQASLIGIIRHWNYFNYGESVRTSIDTDLYGICNIYSLGDAKLLLYYLFLNILGQHISTFYKYLVIQQKTVHYYAIWAETNYSLKLHNNFTLKISSRPDWKSYNDQAYSRPRDWRHTTALWCRGV